MVERKKLPELPVKERGVVWPYRFAELVDEYAAAHGITKTETFRRIGDACGNSPKGVSLRYYHSREELEMERLRQFERDAIAAAQKVENA